MNAEAIVKEFNTLIREAKKAGIKCGITRIYGEDPSIAIMFNGDIDLNDKYQLIYKGTKKERARQP